MRRNLSAHTLLFLGCGLSAAFLLIGASKDIHNALLVIALWVCGVEFGRGLRP
jgi:hypothetical protein